MRKKLLSLGLLLALVFSCAAPAALAEERTLHISDADGLRQLARDCTLDSYSVGLTVLLDADIDLGEEEFTPIPSFSGLFDGQGHTVSHMVTATDGSHQGMFRYIQAEGAVKNLRVEGTVCPDNSRCQVGGIAGTNYGSMENCSFSGRVEGLNYVGGVVGENRGRLENCSAQGTVEGKRFTGGLAGYSTGEITGGENDARVNTSITQGSLELESLNLSSLVSLDLTGAEDTDVVSDSGGIVGFSTGLVSGCVNRGTVGYPHYGYNVGGVAGRQSGFLTGCRNEGSVYGRKDVAGIVGQMEPYMLLKSSTTLADELNRLHYLTSAAMGNLTNMSEEVHAVLAQLRADAAEANRHLGEETPATPEESPVPEPEASPSPAPEGDPSPEPEEAGSTEPQPAEPEPVPETPAPTENETPPASEPEAVPENEVQASSEPAPAEPMAAGQKRGGFVLLAAGGEGEADPLPEISPLPELGQLPDLSGDLDRLAGGMGDLVSIMGDSGGALGQDLTAVSDQLSRVLMMMANAMTGNADHQILEDISEDGSSETLGRVTLCENLGAVEGDRNVGGIAGTMGIEYEFDMEDTLAETIGMGSILSSTYQTRCVCEENVNRGSVSAKWDNVGGVAGMTELGLIRSCQGYGSTESTEGGYAGGVAGYSHTVVRDCWAMCDVDGAEYVGGIAGYGVEISGCASLVGLGDVTACAGAIAGWADMEGEAVSDNVFVHESLGAVDGISYAGRAEPVSYEALLEREGLPEPFKKLSLRFVADGKLVKEIGFTYGGSIDPAELPPVPPKEGATGSWPDYDLSHLTFSDTLEAVYVSRQAAVASEQCRDDGPMSIVLLEGDFSDEAALLLNAYGGEGPPLEEGQRLLEQWELSLIDESYEDGEYTVRYLPPETERGSEAAVLVLKDGAWSPVSAGQSGSYLTFKAQGESLVFCAVERPAVGPDLLVLAGTAGGILLLAGAALLLRGRRKKKKLAAQNTAAEETEETV